MESGPALLAPGWPSWVQLRLAQPARSGYVVRVPPRPVLPCIAVPPHLPAGRRRRAEQAAGWDGGGRRGGAGGVFGGQVVQAVGGGRALVIYVDPLVTLALLLWQPALHPRGAGGQAGRGWPLARWHRLFCACWRGQVAQLRSRAAKAVTAGGWPAHAQIKHSTTRHSTRSAHLPAKLGPEGAAHGRQHRLLSLVP